MSDKKTETPGDRQAEHIPLCPYCKKPIDDAQVRITPISGNVEALLIRVSCRNCHCLVPVQVTLVMAPQPQMNPTRRDSGIII